MSARTRHTPPIRTALAARDLLGDGAHANHAAARLLVDLLATRRGQTPPEWPTLPGPPIDAERLTAARGRLDNLDTTGWDVNDVGTAYEQMIDRGGAWYTPPEVAQAMVALSVGQHLDRLAEHADPGSVLGVVAFDPACGAGVFLVAAARFVAARYAARLLGGATEATVAAVMPHVMAETVFGVDIDPVAVDLAKAALWFEIDGRRPITFMDRNIICGDVLSGPDVQPPKLAERFGRDETSGGER